MHEDQLGLVHSLFAAIRANNSDEIRAVVAKGIELNSYPYFKIIGKPIPLMAAIQDGNIQAYECLLDLGAKMEVNHLGILYSACDHPTILQYLIDHGANVNYQAANGDTLLHELSRYKHGNVDDEEWEAFGQSLNIIKRAGAWINLRNNKGQTPLHVAVEDLTGRMVKELVQRFGASCDLQDYRGLTPWDYAMREEDQAWNYGIVETLIKSWPLINLRGRIRGDWTYLHDVVAIYPHSVVTDKQRILALVRYVLDQRVDVDVLDGKYGITPLGYIAINSFQRPTTAMDVIKLLLEAGADPRKKIGPRQDQPLVEVVLRNEKNTVHPEVLEFFRRYIR